MASLPEGFRAVVLGASGGIGAALCARLRHDPRAGEVIGLSRSTDGLDITDEASVARHAAALGPSPVHLLLCATGILHFEGHPPEKAMKQIDPANMLAIFNANAVGPALVAKHFLPLLAKRERAVAAFLSARVGSIGDNRLGGWVSYRASKAALNQIIRTASIELARSHPEAVLAAMHPGTVRTGLSASFSQGHRTTGPDEAASAILSALDGMPPGGTGRFLAYDGSEVPW